MLTLRKIRPVLDLLSVDFDRCPKPGKGPVMCVGFGVRGL